MKENNFYIVMLLKVAILSGISFEAQSMESTTLLVGVGTVTLVGALVVKNSEPYKTYSKHTARQIEEKEIFDNPYLYAQPLPSTGLEEKEMSGNEKLAAFLKKNEEERNAYNQQAKKNELYWDNKKFIDSYEPTTK